MEYVIAVAIFPSSIPIQECQQKTAVHWLNSAGTTNDFSNCMRDGMITAAQSRLLKGDDYPKVFCRPVDQSAPSVASIDGSADVINALPAPGSAR